MLLTVEAARPLGNAPPALFISDFRNIVTVHNSRPSFATGLHLNHPPINWLTSTVSL